MTPPEAITKLVERYEFHRAAYMRNQYNEAQLRREFVDPFFRALDWDVDNNQGFSEAYKEVAHEDPIKIRGETKFLDYSFRIGGARKFIVEAKKPSVRISEDTDAAYQLRRYGWNAGLKLSILTNFEEFAVYDCEKKPSLTDTAATARIAYFSYKEYPAQWEWIASIFSLKSIQRGSFDKYAVSVKDKRGTATVDEAFLEEIEGWRKELAQNIALRNPSLTVDELNHAVQLIIDRIIFLRISEDRGIEKYGRLNTLREGDQVYQRLTSIFREADDRYNSGLFHFQEERGRDEPPDTLTLGLAVDDKVLKDIIKRLYYPDSPYEFSALPAHLLGQVYEQFLGKVIRLTAGHQAKVEEKPEVKKAGGVYYTPAFIVEYIVKSTIGEWVHGKTPRDVAALKVLDPACGSGSFLLGAYQYLLDWHRDWYIQHLVPLLKSGKEVSSAEVRALLPEPTRRKNVDLPIYKAMANGEESRARSDWKLTTDERKRILLNNIYGVDIDTQAVEVTKLSLLLKVLEGENEQTLSKQLTLFQERALPSLHQNIKCGNSLIRPDFFDNEQYTILDIEQQRKINAFDWAREFPTIMQRGGFDVVIGNPPYVRQELIKEQKEYLSKHYKAYHGVADLYVYFIERGVTLLNPCGIFSYIVANKWMKANYGKPLRKWLITKGIEEIVDFGDLPVFKNAITYPCIIRVTNSSLKENINATQVKSLDFPNLQEYIRNNSYLVASKTLDDAGWALNDKKIQNILLKIQRAGIPLEDYVNGKIYWGIKTGLNEAFVIDNATRAQLIAADPNSAKLIKPYLLGREIKRYAPIESNNYLLYIPWHFPLHDNSITGASKKAELEFKNQYPVIYQYLLQFKDKLMDRNAEETGIRYEWYALQRFGSSYAAEFENPKIFYPEICSKPEFSYDDTNHYANNKCFFISTDDKYLLGILNSNLTYYLFKMNLPRLQQGFFMTTSVSLRKFPIRTIDFSNAANVALHDRLVGLVEKMLKLHMMQKEIKTEQDKMLISREIVETDQRINTLVYDLYGLTPEEIQIVEQSL